MAKSNSENKFNIASACPDSLKESGQYGQCLSDQINQQLNQSFKVMDDCVVSADPKPVNSASSIISVSFLFIIPYVASILF